MYHYAALTNERNTNKSDCDVLAKAQTVLTSSYSVSLFTCLSTVLDAVDYEHKDLDAVGGIDHRVVRPASALHIGL